MAWGGWARPLTAFFRTARQPLRRQFLTQGFATTEPKCQVMSSADSSPAKSPDYLLLRGLMPTILQLPGWLRGTIHSIGVYRAIASPVVTE